MWPFKKSVIRPAVQRLLDVLEVENMWTISKIEDDPTYLWRIKLKTKPFHIKYSRVQEFDGHGFFDLTDMVFSPLYDFNLTMLERNKIEDSVGLMVTKYIAKLNNQKLVNFEALLKGIQ